MVYSDIEDFDLLGEDSSTNSGGLYQPCMTSGEYEPLFTEEEVQKKPATEKKTSRKGKVGRKEDKATKMFSALRTKNEKPLKKEYVRCQNIRGIKKCVRNIEKHRIPKKGIHEFDPKEGEKYEIWKKMEDIVAYNAEVFANLGSTCEGPATDGKEIRKKQRLETPQYRSFNYEYCKRFYEPLIVREFHFLFLQLVYGPHAVCPKTMCRKLSVRCCNSDAHSSTCRETWEKVRFYVTFTMIEQLKLEPFGKPDGTCSLDNAMPDFDELTDIDSMLA